MQNPVMMPSQPQLGTPVPGTTGGLPPVPGLSVTQNPAARQLQSMGRGDDTMLVHMTPNEVNSLQGLAMAAGGSLTINPMTGLPEAGFLKKLLPMLAGIGLNFILPGSGIVAALGGKAATAGLMVGAGTTAITGNLQKGLMAGLGAFGGASLAGGVEGVLASGANEGAKVGAGELTKGIAETATKDLAKVAGQEVAKTTGMGAANIAAAAPSTAAGALSKGTGFLSQFGQAARGSMTGLGAKVAPMAAGMGVLNTVREATAPQMPKYKKEEDTYNYVPMSPGVREVRYQTPEQMRESGGAEFPYFTPSNPEPIPMVEQPRRFAEGGAASGSADNFDELVQYFGATNPGAITASMYPTSPAAAPGAAAPATATAPATAPRPGGEVIHNFGRSTAGNLGLTDTSSLYGTFPGLSGLGGFNFNSDMYNEAISRLRGDLGLGAPAPSNPVAPSAPSTMLPQPENYPLPEVLNFEDIMATYTPAPATAPPPTPAPTKLGPNLPVPVMPMLAKSEPTVAPPIMLDPSQLENYGGPYYTTLPTGPQVEEEEAGYGYGSSGRPVEAYESMMFHEYARGGAVNMRDGSFVVDARTVSELGNGSSNAGIEMLSRMGGRPVRGPGDGVSDSVRASIGGRQEARVARDEVIFPPEAVRRVGGGSEARGTKKLYALMNKAHKARKKAKRGQDTGVRRGLA